MRASKFQQFQGVLDDESALVAKQPVSSSH
jgi:hypothetical protein